MIEEYEIIVENNTLEEYIESIKLLIDNALRENIADDITFKFDQPIYAMFTLLCAELCGGTSENILNAAVSVELINQSSKVFEQNSATAISLLNSAYGLIFETKNISAERQISAHKEIVDCLSANKLDNLQNANLIRLAMRIGAILSNADYIQTVAITRFADLLEKDLQAKTDEVFFNPHNFVEQAKHILQDEFGNTAQTLLLGDLADFITTNKD